MAPDGDGARAPAQPCTSVLHALTSCARCAWQKKELRQKTETCGDRGDLTGTGATSKSLTAKAWLRNIYPNLEGLCRQWVTDVKKPLGGPIEQAFGVLKGRWRILRDGMRVRLNHSAHVVMALLTIVSSECRCRVPAAVDGRERPDPAGT